MRTLLVIAATLVALWNGRPWSTAAAAPTRDLHAGDAITQTALLGYLAPAPRPGDWARRRITYAGVNIEQTIGFGRETVDDRSRPFVEVSLARTGLASVPVALGLHVGGATTAKMYLNADAFGAADAQYQALATVLQIGDSLYRIDYRHAQPAEVTANAPPSRLTPVAPLLLGDFLTGRVVEVVKQNLVHNGRVMRAMRVTASFESALGGSLPRATLRVWQSPDVPLGTIALRALVGGRELNVDLLDYGHGDYVSHIKQALNDIPRLPGSN